MNTQSLLLQIAQGDPTACPILHDWLMDNPHDKPSPEQLALAYAGSPPDHLDGLPQDWLARIFGVMGLHAARVVVEVCEVREYRDNATHYWYVYCGNPDRSRDMHLTSGRALRSLKRRILALPYFAGVNVVLHAECSRQEWSRKSERPALLQQQGFRPNARNGTGYITGRQHNADPCIVAKAKQWAGMEISQSLRAWELIWPEPFVQEEQPQ